MDPQALKVEELDYELAIRNLKPQGNVDTKKKILRGVLSQESADRSFQGLTEHPFSFEDDVKGVEGTLQDLKNIIGDFTGTKQDPTFKRVSARLKHVSGRIYKIKSETSDEGTKRDNLYYDMLALEADLDLKVSGSTSTPTVRNSNDINNSESHNVFSKRSVPPYKWNISFDGTGQKDSVNSFLEKVEMLSIARNVTKQELFDSACDLFKGVAWTWFLNIRAKVNSWDGLVTKLREDFLPYYYDEDLLREINSRTQDSNEKVALFISSMEGLFNRLSKVPDELTRVNKIRRNLLPFFISNLALQEPKTVTELTDLCKKLEESRIWSERYRPPPHPSSGLLEPDLSNTLFQAATYKGGSQSERYENNNFSKKYQNNFSNKNVNASALSSSVCWNCDRPGHLYSRCFKKRMIFCFGCGKKNIVKSKCDVCMSKNVQEAGGKSLNVVSSSANESSPKPSGSQGRKAGKQ